MSIRVEHRHNTAIVVIDRPERRNAVDLSTAIELYDRFREIDQDPGVDVAILTGANGHFCAGADLKSLSDGERNRIRQEGDFGPMGPTRLQMSKPVIAAIEGYAVAGGLELALWCDLRVLSDTAVLGVFCRRFGVPLVDGGTVRLPRLIGQSRAMDLILTGREVTAAEAEAIGLANRVVTSGGALEAAVELAREISSFPGTCMRNDRLSVLQQWGLSEAQAMSNEVRFGLDTVASGETSSGASAFAEGAGRHEKPRR